MRFSYNSFAITPAKLRSLLKKLDPYMARLRLVAESEGYDAPESSIRCPFDERLSGEALSVAKRFDGSKLKYIFLVGIGGSNLAARAVYEALRGVQETITRDTFPKLIFLDTIDPALDRRLDAFFTGRQLSKDEFAVVISSKSGSTLETIANAELLLSRLSQNRGGIADRIVAITDEGSALWDRARERGFHRISAPVRVGGRFSACTPFGTVPLALAGIDVGKFLSGAQRMRTGCLSQDPKRNPAAVSAAILFSGREERCVHDSFLFNPSFASLGAWYRQLLGESIGKGIRAGLTPTVSVGTTDLHSVAQLYLAGPRRTVTTFVTAQEYDAQDPIGAAQLSLAPELERRTPAQALRAVATGTMRAYDRQKLPYMHAELERVDSQSIGEYMQFKMLEVMYLAALWDINAFDQPQVELYKREARRALARGE